MWALSPPLFLTPEEAQALLLPPPQCPPLLVATAQAKVAVVQPTTPLVQPQHSQRTLLMKPWKPAQKNVV